MAIPTVSANRALLYMVTLSEVTATNAKVYFGMRGFGRFLMVVGATVGIAVGLGWVAGINFPDLPWLVAVGLAKLALIASVGLIGAGATLVRLDNRRDRSVTDAEAITGR